MSGRQQQAVWLWGARGWTAARGIFYGLICDICGASTTQMYRKESRTYCEGCKP